MGRWIILAQKYTIYVWITGIIHVPTYTFGRRVLPEGIAKIDNVIVDFSITDNANAIKFVINQLEGTTFVWGCTWKWSNTRDT